MSAGWVAGNVRARAMSRRRLGRAGARVLAMQPSLHAALADLVASPYGHDVRIDHTLAQAQHAVGETLLWNGRVLAGWLPRPGVRLVRLLAAWFELLDVDAQLRAIATGSGAEPRHHLGTLGVIASRLPAAYSSAELHDLLRTSPWGDPGGMTSREVHLWLRLRFAARVRGETPALDRWACGAAALLVARELFVAERRLPPAADSLAAGLLGDAACGAIALAEFVSALPSVAVWALHGAAEPADVWLSESRWWLRMEADSRALLRQPHPGLDPVLGALGVLAADAWRVRAALEIAARGGESVEVFDGVA
jgi:hypothetical protein